MSKKVFATVLCIILMITCSVPAMGLDNESDIKQKIIETEEKINFLNGDLDPFIYVTSGPVLKKYSKVELLNGSTTEIEKINKNLNRELFRLSAILPYGIVFVTEPLDFTISYESDLRNGSRFSYFSMYGNASYDENGSLINITNTTMVTNTHNKVKIDNFTGIFFFLRAKLYRPFTYYLRPIFLPFLFTIIYYNCAKMFFIPARFSFIGTCGNITYLLD